MLHFKKQGIKIDSIKDHLENMQRYFKIRKRPSPQDLEQLNLIEDTTAIETFWMQVWYFIALSPLSLSLLLTLLQGFPISLLCPPSPSLFQEQDITKMFCEILLILVEFGSDSESWYLENWGFGHFGVTYLAQWVATV